MFDGVLPRDEPEPEETTISEPAWSWTLAALVTGLSCLAIIASVLFPNVIGSAADHF